MIDIYMNQSEIITPREFIKRTDFAGLLKEIILTKVIKSQDMKGLTNQIMKIGQDTLIIMNQIGNIKNILGQGLTLMIQRKSLVVQRNGNLDLIVIQEAIVEVSVQVLRATAMPDTSNIK